MYTSFCQLGAINKISGFGHDVDIQVLVVDEALKSIKNANGSSFFCHLPESNTTKCVYTTTIIAFPAKIFFIHSLRSLFFCNHFSEWPSTGFIPAVGAPWLIH